MTTEEINREWATLAGLDWDIAGCFLASAKSEFYATYDYGPASCPECCFGENGPWEWLVGYQPSIQTIEVAPRRMFAVTAYRNDEPMTAYGTTLFQAIAQCALDARKKVENKE